jgi:hypothetical protein
VRFAVVLSSFEEVDFLSPLIYVAELNESLLFLHFVDKNWNLKHTIYLTNIILFVNKKKGRTP